MATPRSPSQQQDHRRQDDAPHDLSGVIERMHQASDDHPELRKVSLRHVLDAVGERSFGTLLIVPGLVALSPLSGIPGMPSTMGLLVILISGQLLLGRRSFWMPNFILDRCISRRRFDRALDFMAKPARWIDRPLQRRLTWLTKRPGLYVVAICCLLVAATMPPLELLPFAASAAGLAISLFALSLIARDGLLALLGITVTGGLAFFAVRFFLL